MRHYEVRKTYQGTRADCFGHYKVSEDELDFMPAGKCTVCEVMYCEECAFYKPLTDYVKECKKYGWPFEKKERQAP